MLEFLIGCVPFALGGLTTTFVWRRALAAEERGEPAGLRLLSGLVLGSSVFATIAVLLWSIVWFPMQFAILLPLVAAPLGFIVLVVAVVRQRDVDIAAWALGSAALPYLVLFSNPPLV
jgi:hypothetical protein